MHLRKRVLVTGGAGFLGSHLCDRLLSKGYDVLCVDNFYTGSKRNIAHLLGNTYFELVRHDITFPLYLEVDEIYNLACPASPIHYQNDPVQTTKVNVHGSINMLGLAKRIKALQKEWKALAPCRRGVIRPCGRNFMPRPRKLTHPASWRLNNRQKFKRVIRSSVWNWSPS